MVASPPAALLVGDEGPDPVGETAVPPVEDKSVASGHGHDDQGRVGEPVIRGRLSRLGQVVQRHDDRHGALLRVPDPPPGTGLGGTIALATWSWAFQPFFCWQVTTKTFWPGRGWPNRATYGAVMSHWPSDAGPNRPR